MKTKESKPGFSLIELLVVIAIIAMVAAIILPAAFKAKAQTNSPDTQGQAQSLYAPTNQPTTLAGPGSSNVNSVIPVLQGKGLALGWTFSGSTNASIRLDATVDGTNYGVLPWLLWIQTNASAAILGITNTYWTNYTAEQLRGIFALRFTTVSNLGTLSYTNSSGGVIVNRPN